MLYYILRYVMTQINDWSKELKLMYDYHPELKVVFTGSSVLDIKKGVSDLSRRAVMYHMQGLSFREYLKLKAKNRSGQPHTAISSKMTSSGAIRTHSPLWQFGMTY